MNWAKEWAEKIADGRVGPVTKMALVGDIAAALQRVADECAEIVEDTNKVGAGHTAFVIRKQFPKEGI